MRYSANRKLAKRPGYFIFSSKKQATNYIDSLPRPELFIAIPYENKAKAMEAQLHIRESYLCMEPNK